MLADARPWCFDELTKNTDSQVLWHRARLDSHIVGRRARIGSI
jgi:hypothetical protein